MKLNLLRGCVIFFITLSGAGQAASKDITTEEYVNSIYLATHQAWPVLENVWDTQVYRQLRLIVADDHNAWAIDSKSLTKVPYREIQRRHLPVEYMHYQEVQWADRRPTIYISLGSTLPPEEKARLKSEKGQVPTVFNVATHEAFHFFVQTNEWKRGSSDNNSRASPYPVQVAPRLYRNSIIRSLYSYLQGDKNGLGHTRYWFDQWKKSYPDDSRNIRQTDIYEGSARYVEISAEIIAKGKKINTEEFQLALINKMKDVSEFIYTQPDSESYPIGALAGFIMNKKNMKWQPNVSQGATPLEILLENSKPIVQHIDNKLNAEISQVANNLKSKVGSAIDNFIKDYNTPSVIKIFVSSDLSGSYSLSDGFFRTKNIPHDLMVGLNSAANWGYGSYSINEVIAADVYKSPDYKGKSGFFILYTGKLPPSKNGRLVLKTERLSLNIPYPDGKDKSNIIYLP